MATDVYGYGSNALAAARERLAAYRGKIEGGVGQVKTMAEVAAGAYGAARLSAHLGGIEGKKILGMPLEVAIGAGAGVVAYTGMAGRYSEDVAAVGLGAVAGYCARAGYTAGLKTAQPPAEVAGYVGATFPGAQQLGAGLPSEWDNSMAVLDRLAV